VRVALRRVGSVKDGKVTAYIPPPPVSDPKLAPPEGITVDSHGAIYAAAQQQSDVKKYKLGGFKVDE
jgi:hypothetical protein